MHNGSAVVALRSRREVFFERNGNGDDAAIKFGYGDVHSSVEWRETTGGSFPLRTGGGGGDSLENGDTERRKSVLSNAVAFTGSACRDRKAHGGDDDIDEGPVALVEEFEGVREGERKRGRALEVSSIFERVRIDRKSIELPGTAGLDEGVDELGVASEEVGAIEENTDCGPDGIMLSVQLSKGRIAKAGVIVASTWELLGWIEAVASGKEMVSEKA